MVQREGGDSEILCLEDDSLLCNLHDDLIIDVHIENAPIGIDILLEFRRTVNGKRLITVDLA
ncbi:hypothetical protein SDC9_43115 [bioreactor metagenome]|uniref:Uncharacterized protein n=1 Tax=bioreactor metagenome TaxID=1076179 RepID=A0A644VZR3_9ZZZZ